MMKLYALFGGTSRFFAFWFFVVGCTLAFLGKLNAEYVSMAGALQALIVAHSIKEDYHERHNGNGGNGNDGDKINGG